MSDNKVNVTASKVSIVVVRVPQKAAVESEKHASKSGDKQP